MSITTEQRITNLLSMAQRARRIVSGSFAVEQAAKEKKAVVLLMAADAADETKKNGRKLADRYGLPYTELLDRERLGGCLGKGFRAIAALTDAGFAKRLHELLEDSYMR